MIQLHLYEGVCLPVCMNIASGEFRGSSYNMFKTCPLVNTTGNFLVPAVKYMICMVQTPSVCEDEIYKDFVRFR